MEHFAMHKPSKIHPSLLPKISDKLRCGNMDSATYYYHGDHLGSASWITNKTGTPVQHLQYMPYGEPLVNERTGSYEERFTFTGKERDSETGFSYFGARYYDSDILTGWLSVDPLADKYPGLSPYAYCHNNPVKLIDPDGKKDKPFRFLINKDVSIIPGTETPTRYRVGKKWYSHPDFKNAYNCHSYAWHDSKGDKNPGNRSCYPDIPTQNGVPLSKWDNNPADDIIEQGAIQLDVNDNNIPGDRVIYYSDANKDGIYNDGEYISHSAIVKDVDENGYTTLVISKMGENGISENHPCAPGFYEIDTDPCSGKIVTLSRAYFRLPKIEGVKNE